MGVEAVRLSGARLRGARRAGISRELLHMGSTRSLGLASLVALAACARAEAPDSTWAKKVGQSVVGVAEASPRPNLWSERGNNLPQGFVPPTSLAPLIKELKPAVVNISTTQIVRRSPGNFSGDPFE